MNMISELRRRVVSGGGKATIMAAEFDQLQAEWITRTKAEYMVHNLTVASTALQEIANSPFDVEGFPCAKDAAHEMNNVANTALAEFI